MPIGKIKFFWDSMGSIKELIGNWKPPSFKTEGEYEKDLYKYLCDNITDIEVVRQYGSSRVRVDLCVGRKVFIEMKKDLNSTSKLQRLLGQLELYYKEKWENIIIILIGEVEKNLERHLLDSLKKFESGLFEENWAVIKK